MNFFLDPNIAYLMLVIGVLLTLMAIITPGTGLLEVGAAICLLLAGYAVYNISFSLWALIILVISIVPFIFAIQKKQRGIFLALSIILLIIGSVFLFKNNEGGPAVNPWIASVTSILTACFLWFVTQKTLQAIQSKPTHNLEKLIGEVGEAKTRIYEEGSVQVAGELWSACSNTPIPPGTQVRVVERDGFILKVEKY